MTPPTKRAPRAAPPLRPSPATRAPALPVGRRATLPSRPAGSTSGPNASSACAPAATPAQARTGLGPTTGRSARARRTCQRLYVYAGPGTDPGCVAALRAQLRQLAAARGGAVRTLDARDMRDGRWRADAALVCFPGGRDLPYLRALRGPPLGSLRRWVLAGGRYFGSCAGAYFAAARLHFAAARVPPVVGHRPLRLFRGVAVGPSQGAATFTYAPGAPNALRVRLADGTRLRVFNRGGCAFVAPGRGAWPADARVCARADVEVPSIWTHGGGVDGAGGPRASATPGQARPWAEAAVAVTVQCGRGRALLWGAHPELPLPSPNGAPPTARDAWRRTSGSARLLRAQLAALLRQP